MKRLAVIFAITLCLIPNTVKGAESGEAEPKPKKIKNAQKVIAYLNTAGIYDDRLKKVAVYLDENSEDGKLNLMEQEYKGFKMQFQFDIGMPEVKDFQEIGRAHV